MTREEAIANLNMISGAFVEPVTKEQRELIDETFDMAIKALEREPCKCFTCKYGEWKRKGWDITMADDKCGGCCSWNDKYEPLEQEPKTGHWIETDEWRETVDGFEQWGYFRKCNKCGYVFKFLEIDNYCPNCGCRMESEDKE